MGYVFSWIFEFSQSSKRWLSWISAALIVTGSLVIQTPAARAKTEEMVVEVPVERPLGYHDLLHWSELSIQAEISRRFQQDLSLSTLKISALINRNGEVVPLFTTTVSRDQWNQSTQISRWTKYHDAYALLQRHNDNSPKRTVVAAAPRTVARPGFSPALDAAFDRGALTGEQIQSTLSRWD